MLVLTRKAGQSLVIDGGIVVRVVSVEGGKVRLGISAPADVAVDRAEVHARRLEFARAGGDHAAADACHAVFAAPGDVPSTGTVPAVALEQLEALVLARLEGRVQDFRLAQRPDGLVLQGRAPTYYLKQLAQTELQALCDCPITANEITVR